MIGIDDQGSVLLIRKGFGDADSQSGLSNASFEIDDGKYWHGNTIRGQLGRW